MSDCGFLQFALNIPLKCCSCSTVDSTVSQECHWRYFWTEPHTAVLTFSGLTLLPSAKGQMVQRGRFTTWMSVGSAVTSFRFTLRWSTTLFPTRWRWHRGTQCTFSELGNDFCLCLSHCMLCVVFVFICLFLCFSLSFLFNTQGKMFSNSRR